jgi:bifunctional pyridoxal-dependent enzyme with beta-cystathionase and maltose regulon repressor activities
MSRTLIPAPLQPDGPSRWSWDHEQLEADLTRANAKVLLLVNPHNPTGRVFTESELRDIAYLADLAERHDLIVVSDEIHAELTHDPHQHTPFASVGVTIRRPEAGYLAWLDCIDAGLPGDPATWFRQHARIELSPRPEFGTGNSKYARLNFATTTAFSTTSPAA